MVPRQGSGLAGVAGRWSLGRTGGEPQVYLRRFFYRVHQKNKEEGKA
jgi:hypothetical protein